VFLNPVINARVVMGRTGTVTIDNITIEDPGTFTQPINLKLTATHVRPGTELMAFVCTEDNEYGIAGGFKPGTGIGNAPQK